MVKGKSDRIFDAVIYVILAVTIFICLFPLMYIVSVSLTPMSEVLKGGFIVIPKKITFDAYRYIWGQEDLPRAMWVTVWTTVAGTGINMVLTSLVAYPLSKYQLPGRKWIMRFIAFTMMFSGGTIPTYILVKNLGLTDTYWALLIPSAISTYNMIVMKTFFENLPGELFESAYIDGAGYFKSLISIAIPLSKPVMLTVGLYYAVGHWNTYFNAIMYLSDTKMHTLQVVLRKMLMENPEAAAESMIPAQTAQMAAVVFASLPIIIIYPFIQKYFTKGVMLGAVKG